MRKLVRDTGRAGGKGDGGTMQQGGDAVRRAMVRRAGLAAAAGAAALMALTACTGATNDPVNSPVAQGNSVTSDPATASAPSTSASAGPALITTSPMGR